MQSGSGAPLRSRANAGLLLPSAGVKGNFPNRVNLLVNCLRILHSAASPAPSRSIAYGFVRGRKETYERQRHRRGLQACLLQRAAFRRLPAGSRSPCRWQGYGSRCRQDIAAIRRCGIWQEEDRSCVAGAQAALSAGRADGVEHSCTRCHRGTIPYEWNDGPTMFGGCA